MQTTGQHPRAGLTHVLAPSPHRSTVETRNGESAGAQVPWPRLYNRIRGKIGLFGRLIDGTYRLLSPIL